VELRVRCAVCRMLLYWFCFVACMLWVIEGQLKKRVRVIWALRNTVGKVDWIR